MYRFTAALILVIASATASSAQNWRPTIWQSERGAILKVLSVDSATGNFSGVFISSPTGPCPAVLYDLAGRVWLPQRHVVFTTSRTWTSDCAATVVWSGRATGSGTAAVTWTLRSVGPNDQVIRRRGVEFFKRI